MWVNAIARSMYTEHITFTRCAFNKILKQDRFSQGIRLRKTESSSFNVVHTAHTAHRQSSYKIWVDFSFRFCWEVNESTFFMQMNECRTNIPTEIKSRHTKQEKKVEQVAVENFGNTQVINYAFDSVVNAKYERSTFAKDAVYFGCKRKYAQTNFGFVYMYTLCVCVYKAMRVAKWRRWWWWHCLSNNNMVGTLALWFYARHSLSTD